MIKNEKLFWAIVVTSVLLFTGCSQKEMTPSEKKEEMISTIKNLPDWVLKPNIEGSISAVGMTEYSKHGLHVMLTLAEMDARAKLAGKMQTIVSQVQKKSIRHVSIEKIDEFEQLFKQVTKEVISEIPLSGAKRINIFQAGDGALYVHSIISNKEVSRYLVGMKDKYKTHMKEANLSRENIDKGMIVLDKMLDELNTEDKEIK